MSKTLTWVLVAGVVVIGGYFVLNGKENDKVANPLTDMEEKELETSDKKMAFSEFLKQGGSYKCIVSQNINGTEAEVTTYMDGKMVRNEYSTSTQGIKVDSSMIIRDGYTYSWTSMAPNSGFKMKMAVDTEEVYEDTIDYGFDADQIGDYNCEAWSSDQSKFAIPSNVKFQELGAQ